LERYYRSVKLIDTDNYIKNTNEIAKYIAYFIEYYNILKVTEFGLFEFSGAKHGAVEQDKRTERNLRNSNSKKFYQTGLERPGIRGSFG
jgi:hypothetical protein